MKIKTHMRTLDDDGINDYIISLENYILELKASNTNQLIFKLDELNGTIVEDLDKVISGEATEFRVIGDETVEVSTLKILNDSKDSKVYDRVMTLYTKLKDLKAVADLVKAMIPEVEEKPEEVSKIVLKKGQNPFEQLTKAKTGGDI